MENEQTPAPPTPVAATPEPAFDLATYRASREPKAATETETKTAAKPTAEVTEPAAAGAEALGDAETETEPVKKKLGGFQKTISKQSEEIADLKRQLAGTPAGSAPGDAKPAESTTEAKPAPAAAAAPDYEKVKAKPRLEDSADLAEFTEKLADWTQDRRDWLKAGREAAAKQQAAVVTLAGRWKASETAFKTEHPDYAEVVKGVDDVRLSAAHQTLFLESENGVALAYQLAQNPAELRRIAALPPLKAAVEIGKLEAAFAKQATPAEEEAEPEIKVSSAPKPFKPVNGATTRGTPNVADLSPADYRKARESGRIQ